MLPETHVQKLQNITLKILGNEYKVSPEDVKPDTSLNEYLREVLSLKGTKHMCLEGGCGACVVVARKKATGGTKDEIFAINSCLVPVLSCNDWEIETVDGIGGPPGEYHMVQKALADFNGTQCGYCSPGMVMNMYALYESGEVTMQEVENSFGGNICRCTGYRPILAAFKSLCKDADEALLGKLPDIEDTKVCKQKICRNDCPIPCSKKNVPFSMCWEGSGSKWVKVYTLLDLLEELKNCENTTCMLIAGSTGKGVYRITEKPAVYIDLKDVADLLNHKMGNNELILGANVSLTYAMNAFYKIAAEDPKFEHLKKLGDHIDLIANVPVRNAGTLAGNLMLKHQHHEFPSDIFLSLETAGASITIIDTNASETIVSVSDFLNTDMKLKVMKNITIPALDSTYKYESYKIMPRAQNAHALVNAGFLFKFNNNVVEKATIVYGCINPTFIHAKNTEAYLVGKDLFDANVLREAYKTLEAELQPDVVPAEPQPEFRKQLAMALFYKAVLSWAPDGKVSPKNKSGGEKLSRPVSSGTQDYETNKSLYPLTQAIPKIEALAQTSGRAEYVDDIPDAPNELFAKFLLADAPPSSDIKSIDSSKALEHPGIVAVYTKDDIPGLNNFLTKDFPVEEEIFCSKTVKYHSQSIGLIVGKTMEALHEASSLVKVEYTPPKAKPLLTVPDILKAKAQDKIKHEGTFPAKRKGGDVKHVIKGTFDIGMQYHYHMELQACKVVPTEDGLNVYPTTQYMELTQNAIANMLNLHANQINVNVRRCGGAFGAKITRNSLLSCATSLAAWKLRKPVKLIMSMEENCQMIGKRFPLYCDYEAAVNDGGVIQYLKADLYSDMGQGGNEKPFIEVLDLFSKNYDSDTFELETYSAYTDMHPNTWCRAPGSTEGLGAIESIMEHIAYEINMDPVQLRIANVAEKNKTLLNYFSDLKEWASIDQRKKDIENFNKENRWKKKGLAVVPMTYGFHAYGPLYAVVTIYQHDGSVAISHSGIEIGQGINTKAAQVCAYKLGIPLEKVTVKPTNNFSGANSFGTGGSFTSEGVCHGIIKACDELLERLKPHTKPTWEETVLAAYSSYVNLSANGQYSPNQPEIKNYIIYGICASEILLDVLTGQYFVTRVDLIEDCGNSMSPMVDIGQVEGAFVMGMGYYTSEKVLFDEEGRLLSNRTWNYKPPGAKDIPIDFRVKFPKNNENPDGVLKSKATGEPPLCMSVSVPLAIRNAVASARADSDSTKPKWYPFEGPSTVEHTFMECLNNSTQYVL